MRTYTEGELCTDGEGDTVLEQSIWHTSNCNSHMQGVLHSDTHLFDTHAGGYHPVQVGDKFKSGVYTVLRKLGWGHFSTVWLVVNNDTGAYGAMKVR